MLAEATAPIMTSPVGAMEIAQETVGMVREAPATVHPLFPQAEIAAIGNTIPNIAVVLPTGTEPQQTGLGEPRAVILSQTGNRARGSRLAARAASWPATGPQEAAWAIAPAPRG